MTSLNVNKLNITTINHVCNFITPTSPTLETFVSSNFPANTTYVNNCIISNIVPIYKTFTANSITSTVTQKISLLNPISSTLTICPTGSLTIDTTMTTLKLKTTTQSFSNTWNNLLTCPITSTKMLSGSGTFSGGQAALTFTPNFNTTPSVVLTITQGTTPTVYYRVSSINTAGAVANCTLNYTFNWVAIGT